MGTSTRICKTNNLIVPLRAAACKNQESADKSDFMDFFIFCPEKPFGELLSKITIKLSRVFVFEKFGKT